ncbi:MAG: hypothetical protein ACM3YO_02990 [Bacteroidota bacterium]
MSPSIEKSHASVQVTPKRSAPPQQPSQAAKPPVSRDRLTLSSQATQRESLESLTRLKVQLENPLPPAPSKPETSDWESLDRFCREALIQSLRQDEAVNAGLKSWNALPQDMRLLLGKRISDIQAGIFGFQPAPIRFEEGIYRGGFQPGTKPSIDIGPKARVSANEFLNTVVHEQNHAFQWEKANKAMIKKLDPNDPYAAVAETWLDNFIEYTNPSKGVQAYRSQPIEVQSASIGNQIAEALLGKP